VSQPKCCAREAFGNRQRLSTCGVGEVRPGLDDEDPLLRAEPFGQIVGEDPPPTPDRRR
jgi:hypothetical protein